MRPALLAFALALSLVAACGPATSATPSTPPTAPAAAAAATRVAAPAAPAPAGSALTFAWPVPLVLRVRERADKGTGTPVTMRYELHVSRAPDSDDTLIDFQSFAFVEIADRPITAEEQAQFARMSALTGAIPTLRVARDGSATVDDADIDAAVSTLVAFLLESGEAAQDEEADLRAYFASPQARAALTASSLDFWRRWVALWAGAGAEPGSSTVEMASPLPDGSQLASQVTVVNAGPVDDGVSLSATWELSGDNARRAVETTMKAALEAIELEQDDEFDVDAVLGSARVTGAVQAVVDPATLVPHAVSSVETVEVQIDGQTQTSRETHDYEFERVQ